MILPEDIDVNTAGASLGRVQKGDHQNLNVCGRYEKKATTSTDHRKPTLESLQWQISGASSPGSCTAKGELHVTSRGPLTS